MRYRLAVVAVVLMVWSAGPARAQDRTFESWRASCAEGACAGVTAAQAGQVTLRLSRADTPAAPWHISLRGLARSLAKTSALTVRVDRAAPVKLAPGTGFRAIDGEHFIADRAALARLLPALRSGRTATVSFMHVHGIERRITFSLAGLAQALLWIDERQGRAGSTQTVAAPGEPGDAPPRPAPPEKAAKAAAPQPAAPKPAPRGAVPANLLERHRADPDCERRADLPGQGAAVVHRLDASRRLYLLPCSSGAYNVLSKIYVYDTRHPGEIKPQAFAAFSDALGWHGKDFLINPNYDAKTRTLTAFEKGRGLGDCGSLVGYRWTGDGLRMLEYRHWGKCDGSRIPKEWPVIYKYAPPGGG